MRDTSTGELTGIGRVETITRARADGTPYAVYRVRWWHPTDTVNGKPVRYPFSKLASVSDGEHFRAWLALEGRNVRPGDPWLPSGWRDGHVPNSGKAQRGILFGAYALQIIDATRGNTDSTKEEKRAQLRNHFADFAKKPVHEITNADCWAKWDALGVAPYAAFADRSGKVRQRAGTLSPRTVIGYMWFLSSVFDAALRDELIAFHPFREPGKQEIELPRGDRVPAHHEDDPTVDSEGTMNLAPGHYNALLRAAKYVDYQQFVLVKLILKCGLRIGETLALQVKHLDLGDDAKVHVAQAISRDRNGSQRVTFPKKGTRYERAHSDRWIPLDDEMRDLLIEYLGADATQPNRFVFPRPRAIRGNAGWNYANWLSARWYKIVERARAVGELPPEIQPTPHKLRHTFAAQMLAKHVTMHHLSVLMGHESEQTTNRNYAHLCKVDASTAAREAMAQFGTAG